VNHVGVGILQLHAEEMQKAAHAKPRVAPSHRARPPPARTPTPQTAAGLSARGRGSERRGVQGKDPLHAAAVASRSPLELAVKEKKPAAVRLACSAGLTQPNPRYMDTDFDLVS
jgi:hypothetical protein